MSRSYKKFPSIKSHEYKSHIRYSNRKLRHDKLAEIPRGGAYRKNDDGAYYKYPWYKEQAINQYYSNERIRNSYALDDWLNYWASCTIRK